MKDADLQAYCGRAVERGALHAKEILPSSVVTAPWVRLKCQYGCANYGRSFCCPPYTPTPEETRRILEDYHRAILFHFESPHAPDRRNRMRQFLEMLIDLEGEIFKDGYYKAFVFLEGPCHYNTILRQQDEMTPCTECAKIKGNPCKFGMRARPSMEGCGIDVYQTARNNGFFIQPLREKTETQNLYCLMLVD